MRGLVVPEIVDSISTRHPTYICEYGVMVAAMRLGRIGVIRGGSSPSTRTMDD